MLHLKMNNQVSSKISGHSAQGSELPDKKMKYLPSATKASVFQVERKHASKEIPVIERAGQRIDAQDHSLETGTNPSFQKKRNYFTYFQKFELEELYFQNSYPSKEICEYLASRFATTPHSIKIWFKNRRVRQKKNLSQPPKHYQLAASHSQQHFKQVYNPYAVRKDPHFQQDLRQISILRGPRMTLGLEDPSLRRRSAFSVYSKSEHGNSL